MEHLDYRNIDAIGLILGLFSIFIGIKYPDWDFKLKLKHRSIVTHSPLILILFVYLYIQKENATWWFSGEKEIGFRYFIIGFSIGMGIHFLYDLFPKGWKGSALLHIPVLKKRIRHKGSISLFIIFTIFSFGVAIMLSKINEETILFLSLGLLLLWLNKRKEGKLIRPLVSYLIIYFILACLLKENFGHTMLETLKVVWEYVTIVIDKIFTLVSHLKDKI